MGLGIPFTLLAIAALLAPIAWVLWWGAGSLAGGRLAVAPPAPPRAQAMGGRRILARPQPSDRALPGRPGAIAMYSLANGRELGHCQGPDAEGRCPRPLADGSVPCAGCLLALPMAVRGSREWHVPNGYRACLVGGYAVYRPQPTVAATV